MIEGLSVSQACRFMGISRQAFYQQRSRWKQQEDLHTEVVEFVIRQRLQHPRMGMKKLWVLLQQTTELHIGRDAFHGLLKQRRLLVQPRRAYHKTTHSYHRFRCHPNLIKSGKDQFIPDRCEKLWVADITYLPMQTGEAYLSLVTDAFSRKIVGYQVDDNLKAQSVLQAYKRALKNRQHDGALVHHSDRGLQYCSKAYQAIHAKYGVQCSMTDGYDCYQNALAERVNGILKNEYLLRKPKDLTQAKQMVAESIYLYNHDRPHMALKYKTPSEVHRAF